MLYNPHRIRDLLLFALHGLIIAALVGGAGFYVAQRLGGNSAPFESARVTRVLDGDTFELENGELVRYIGVDAPESLDPAQPVECFGPEAAARNRELVEGKIVDLLRGSPDRDDSGRLLRYVFVDRVFVNAELIAEGYARQNSYGAERRFQQVFVQLQQYSINQNNGLWSACPPE
jgi:micrococcal nuclease